MALEITLGEIKAYLLDEADFNRSWADGRRGGPTPPAIEYATRRNAHAEKLESWAAAISEMIESLQRRAPAPASSTEAVQYRLLDRGRDTIQADDEFLREDGVTWVKDPAGVFVGCTYQGDILLPARRAIEAAHGITKGDGT